MKKILFGLIILISSGLSAQTSFFSPRVAKAADSAGQIQKINPSAATYYSVATPQDLADFLQAVPGEEQITSSAKSLLQLPAPDGSVSPFRLTRYQIITDELQADGTSLLNTTRINSFTRRTTHATTLTRTTTPTVHLSPTTNSRRNWRLLALRP